VGRHRAGVSAPTDYTHPQDQPDSS
jgi:hypothetical protein